MRAPAPPRKALLEPRLGREQGPSLLATLPAEHLFSSGAGSLNSVPTPQALLRPRHIGEKVSVPPRPLQQLARKAWEGSECTSARLPFCPSTTMG